jgi:cytosine/adenosine deaminase-related metal-dependent hydrolase
MASRICFRPSMMLVGEELQPVKDQSLIVTDGRIEAIGEPDWNCRQVELKGALLVPMFIDAHTHVGDTGAKELCTGLPLEQAVIPPHGLKHRFLASLDTDAHIAMMRHGLLEMLSNGIIACADFREQGLTGVRNLRRAAEDLPIRVRVLGRMDEKLQGEALYAEASELLEEADGLGVRDACCYDASILARLTRAYRHKIFAAHVSEDRHSETVCFQQSQQSQTQRALEWGAQILVHLVHASDEDLQLAARSGVFGVSCPRSNSLLGDGLPRLSVWERVGLPFGLGSDNVMLSSPDMLREMDYASRMTRGMTEEPTAISSLTLLKAATITGARALQLDQELGSLSPGKEASFIAFDLNSLNLTYIHDPISALVHRASTADIAGIYIRGELWKQSF